MDSLVVEITDVPHDGFVAGDSASAVVGIGQPFYSDVDEVEVGGDPAC